MASLVFVLIIVGGALFLWRAGGTSRGRAGQRLIIVLFAVLVVVAVVFPETTSAVASWIGVGRGADLVAYITAFGLMFLAAISYMKSKSLEEKLARVVSESAATEALHAFPPAPVTVADTDLQPKEARTDEQ